MGLFEESKEEKIHTECSTYMPFPEIVALIQAAIKNDVVESLGGIHNLQVNNRKVRGFSSYSNNRYIRLRTLT
jgi:hypothetical protein